MPLPLRLALLACLSLGPAAPGLTGDDDADALIARALAAQEAFETEAAIEHLLAAAELRPNDAPILQKIARQYSDSVIDATTDAERRARARQALAYAERAVALDPDNAVNQLSVAIAYAKLSLYSDTRSRVAHVRAVRESADRALELDPDYAWAHHVMGRWHYEIVEAGSAKRFFANILFGGLPPGSATEAVRHLERAVELEPDNLIHHLELGFAYHSAGRITDARRQWQHGLDQPSIEKHDDEAKARARAALAASAP